MRASGWLIIAVLAGASPLYVGAQEAPKSELQGHEGSGKINTIDPDGSQVNITHGPIESLGWPGMTMNLPVKNKADLAKIKPGQSVTFVLEKDTKGRYVITQMKPAP